MIFWSRVKRRGDFLGREDKVFHRHIKHFNPDVVVLSDIHQDLQFKAGIGYENFDSFLLKEAREYAENGDGVTYLVFNVLSDEYGSEVYRELVSYYTLSATAIPYIDRIRLDEEEVNQKNGFNPMKINMQPLQSIDSEYTAMYLTLKEVYMNYEE